VVGMIGTNLKEFNMDTETYKLHIFDSHWPKMTRFFHYF